jgi:hypothetical protein
MSAAGTHCPQPPAAPNNPRFHGPLQRVLGDSPCELDGLRTLAQKDVSRKFARDVVGTFIAQSSHIDVVQ